VVTEPAGPSLSDRTVRMVAASSMAIRLPENSVPGLPVNDVPAAADADELRAKAGADVSGDFVLEVLAEGCAEGGDPSFRSDRAAATAATRSETPEVLDGAVWP
jgi:hypothetical protein